MNEICTARDRFSADNAGRYPTSLRQLSPLYLRCVPTCPATGRDTYSTGYTSASDSFPSVCTLVCHGQNHADAGLPADRPLLWTNSCYGITRWGHDAPMGLIAL